MDWQTPEDTVPSSFITEANVRALIGKPRATGAWREGDAVGHRRFASIGTRTLERGGQLPAVRIAYETWGELEDGGANAILVLHALTGDSHVVGRPGPGIRPRDGGPASSARASTSTPTAGSSSPRTCSAAARAAPARPPSRRTGGSGPPASRT